MSPSATPKGWRRYALQADNLAMLLEEARPHLGEGEIVGAWGWKDGSEKVRRIELHFENNATWILRMRPDGRQDIEHRVRTELVSSKARESEA